MDPVTVNITHKGQPHTFQISGDSYGSDLQKLIFEKLHVPVEKQKLVGVKFAPDMKICEIFVTKKPAILFGAAVKPASEGASSSSADVMQGQEEGPAHVPQSVEPEQAPLLVPPGLENTENTCYMNSTLQILRAIPELSSPLFSYRKPPGDNSEDARLTSALQDLFREVNTTYFSGENAAVISAKDFLSVIREIVPQFAEKEQDSPETYAQQDAFEALQAIVSRLRSTLKIKISPDTILPWVEKYMTARKSSVLTCSDPESTDPPVESVDELSNLSCHVTVAVSNIRDGLALSLTDKIEKRSESLGRNVVFEKKSKLSRLPRYLPIQLMRFGWKTAGEGAGTKTKIIRKVAFPMEFDVSEFCTDELRKRMQPLREELYKYRAAQLELARAKRKARFAAQDALPAQGPAGASGDHGAGAGAEAPAKKDGPHAEIIETLRKCQNDIKALLDADGDFRSDIGANPSGLYELVGVVTHQGPHADRGHYISFIRQDETEFREKSTWWCFDDSTVYLVDAERLETLYGGNAHGPCAFMLLYRAAPVPGL